LHEEKKELLAQIASMRTWVVEVEHIFDGSWAKQAEDISNAEVGKRFDAYLERLACFVEAEGLNAFEARTSPMLRYRRLSSHH
jgi:hypothetical protein